MPAPAPNLRTTARPTARSAARATHRRRRAVVLPASAALLALLLGGCTPAAEQEGAAPDGTSPDGTSAAGTTAPRPVPDVTSPAVPVAAAPVEPSGDPEPVATGLDTPWSVVPLADGSALVSSRDTGEVLEIASDGDVSTVGTVEGVEPGGEAGLLGLAVAPGDESLLYLYYTGADDNRVVRVPLSGAAGERELGEQEALLTGIPKASNHDGGRIAFGPDGLLYITAGDAGDTSRAQDPQSLGGKILRIAPDGTIPADNPTPGSPVYSLGHRNPQGITWTADGRMWASEFGQDTVDEVNRIVAGGNYGWPEVEGLASDPADTAEFIDPVAQWPTDDASPSGLVAIGSTLFLAALAGESVWSIPLGATTGNRVESDGRTTTIGADSTRWFEGEFGRIRDLVEAPDGALWFVSSNTDGRGDPGEDDDVLYRVPLAPVG